MIKYLYSPPEADQHGAGIFHIPYSHASGKPNGYALLLTIMVLSAMLVISLTITGIVIVQVRLSTRIFNAMRALAMADSGIEQGLYADFCLPPMVCVGPLWGASVPSGTIGPVNVGSGSYIVEKCPTDVIPCGPPNATTLRSVGRYGDTQRSVEVTY